MNSEPVLEFEALRALVGRYVRSALGRGELEQVAPSGDRAAIETAIAEAAEGIDYLRASSQPQPASRGAAIRINFSNIADPASAVARLRIEGATLEAQEIYELTRLLDSGRRSPRRPRLRRPALPASLRLRRRHSRLYGNSLMSSAAKFFPAALLADHASVALGRLRRDIEKQRQSIHHSLERFLRAHQADGTLQEDFVTIRNDRFVVPVVTGRERRVDGVIHGASGSGHTLFVEPLETIGLNNELVRLTEEEAARSPPHSARVHSPPARPRPGHRIDDEGPGASGTDFRQSRIRAGLPLRGPPHQPR